MYKVFNPELKNWPTLIRRPLYDLDLINETVDEIFKNVKIYGDKSLIKYSKKFDKVDLKNLLVCDKKINKSLGLSLIRNSSEFYQVRDQILNY